MQIEPFIPRHLPQVQALVNLHLAAVAPGWGISASHLARHLERDETETVTDPWVIDRKTLCAVEGYRVLAAAHLLRYGDGPEVGDSFCGVGEIGWIVAYPKERDALAALLDAAHAQLVAWRVTREYGWGAGLPAGPFGGVADTWPHVIAALQAAGYQPGAAHREALYGGSLLGIPSPGDPPIAGLALRRVVGTFGTRFDVLHGDEEIGHCDVLVDLTHGGAVPAPHSWAELGELEIAEGWRNRGIGGWLVRHAVRWLVLGGAERIVLSVAADDESAGAGRFYQRFGWNALARMIRLWPHVSMPDDVA